MRIVDVPKYPAYLVFHDAYDNGAMEVYPHHSLEAAQKRCDEKTLALEGSGHDEAGMWKAYEKLPRKRVWKYHWGFISNPEEN